MFWLLWRGYVRFWVYSACSWPRLLFTFVLFLPYIYTRGIFVQFWLHCFLVFPIGLTFLVISLFLWLLLFLIYLDLHTIILVISELVIKKNLRWRFVSFYYCWLTPLPYGLSVFWSRSKFCLRFIKRAILSVFRRRGKWLFFVGQNVLGWWFVDPTLGSVPMQPFLLLLIIATKAAILAFFLFLGHLRVWVFVFVMAHVGLFNLMLFFLSFDIIEMPDY